jgi:hypothetical protein
MLAAAHGQLPEVQAALHFKMATVAEREGWPGDYRWITRPKPQEPPKRPGPEGAQAMP